MHLTVLSPGTLLEMVYIQGADTDDNQFQEQASERGDKFRSIRLDAAASQIGGQGQIRSHPDMQVGFVYI